MPFINFMRSIKNSFLGRGRTLAGEQNEQAKARSIPRIRPPTFAQAKRAELLSSTRYLQQAEKTAIITRHTVIIGSGEAPNPLIIRTPQRASKKGREQGKKQDTPPSDADSHSFLFDLIMETENLGPVLLRLDREGRQYRCTFHAESEEVASYLYQDFEEIRPLLAEYLQQTNMSVGFSGQTGALENNHFIIDTRV